MRVKRWMWLWLCMIAPVAGVCGSEDGVWIIEQDFIKFGKKEVFEKYKKEMLAKFTALSEQPNVTYYGLEELDSPQFLFLTPIQSFSGVETLMAKRDAFRKSFSDQGWKEEVNPYLSTLNFCITSAHQFLPLCSYSPKGKEAFEAYGYVQYFLYGITPGDGPAFEARLKQIAAAQQTAETPVCIRSWRVLFGSDVPKYIVAVFADSEDQASDLADGLEIINAEMKNILRSERKGKAVMRKDLSILGSKS